MPLTEEMESWRRLRRFQSFFRLYRQGGEMERYAKISAQLPGLVPWRLSEFLAMGKFRVPRSSLQLY
jgi:hypothetical protein